MNGFNRQQSDPTQPVAEFNRVLFNDAVVTIGRFHARPEHPRFHNSGLIARPVMAFPHTTVEISHVQGPKFHSNEKLITFYNSEQDYRRSAFDVQGDICDWFEFAPEVILNALEPYQRSDSLEETKPFEFALLPSYKAGFLRQRLLVNYLLQHRENEKSVDDDWVLEQALLILSDSLLGANEKREKTTLQHKRLSELALAYLNVHYDNNEPLSEMAKALDCSTYHLCRVFKKVVGQSIHQYKNELRLRKALGRITSNKDLTTIALELGYNSHSHFTSAFSRYFGMPPVTMAKQLLI